MTGYGLKKIPSDIYKFIYQEQDRIKKQKGTNSYSFELAIYCLLREHPRFSEFKKQLEQNEVKSLHHDL
jgi:hypothetical protein